jgi:hypothetical protein
MRQGRHGRPRTFSPENRGSGPPTSSNAPPAACRPNSGDQKGKTDREGKGTIIAISRSRSPRGPPSVSLSPALSHRDCRGTRSSEKSACGLSTNWPRRPTYPSAPSLRCRCGGVEAASCSRVRLSVRICRRLRHIRQTSDNNEARPLRFGCGLGPSAEGFEGFIRRSTTPPTG